MICRECKDRGYLLWIYPRSKPIPAYWFKRGAGGEKPVPCDKCDYHKEEPKP